MKNILCNPQSAHLKHFIKVVRISVSCMPLKWFSSSLFGSQTLNVREPERKKDVLLLKGNIKSLSTSVKKLEKITETRTSKEKNICIIYNGSLTHRIKGIKVFTIITSICGLSMQPRMLQNILNGNDVPIGVALLSCVGFFTFVTPFLFHLITKKYVTEIWYNSATDTYTATVLSFFLQRININFKIEDIKVPTVPPIFSTMYIRGRPVFINVDSFLEVEHYIKMMGYDKPLDLKDAITDSVNKSNSKEKSKVQRPFVVFFIDDYKSIPTQVGVCPG